MEIAKGEKKTVFFFRLDCGRVSLQHTISMVGQLSNQLLAFANHPCLLKSIGQESSDAENCGDFVEQNCD